VGASGAGKLGGEHDWKDDSKPVENVFAGVVCDSDADTAIEEGVRLVPHATDGPQAAMRAVGVPFGHGVNHCIRFVLARMEVTLIVAGLAQRLVLVPTFPTLPRPDGVAVNQPAGGVSIRLRPRTLSDVEPVSPT
jgi:hypothetical protein